MALPDRDLIKAIPIAYVGFDDQPIQLANSFLVQVNQDEVILSVGQLAPPILLGTPDEVREQAEGVAFVPNKIVARFGMTVTRARELADLLISQVAVHEKQAKKKGAARAGE